MNTQVVKQLEDRGWIEVIGHRDVPGRPALYATTRQFLDDLGLKALDELPPLADPSAQLNADLLGQHAIEFSEAATVQALASDEEGTLEGPPESAVGEAGAEAGESLDETADHGHVEEVGEASGTEIAGEYAEEHQTPVAQTQHAEPAEASGAVEAGETAELAEARRDPADAAQAPESHQDAAAAPNGQEHAEAANVEPQAGAAEPALNHDPVSQADPAIPAHDSGVLRDTEHAAEPNPTTAAHGDPEDRRDAAQDAGILTDDEPESRSA